MSRLGAVTRGVAKSHDRPPAWLAPLAKVVRPVEESCYSTAEAMISATFGPHV